MPPKLDTANRLRPYQHNSNGEWRKGSSVEQQDPYEAIQSEALEPPGKSGYFFGSGEPAAGAAGGTGFAFSE
jgi:hypothetical protein